MSVYLVGMTLADILEQKRAVFYECKFCDFNTCKKNNYEKHIETIKHMRLIKADKKSKKEPTSLMVCKCGDEFKHRQSLWKHKQKCKINQSLSSQNND